MGLLVVLYYLPGREVILGLLKGRRISALGLLPGKSDFSWWSHHSQRYCWYRQRLFQQQLRRQTHGHCVHVMLLHVLEFSVESQSISVSFNFYLLFALFAILPNVYLCASGRKMRKNFPQSGSYEIALCVVPQVCHDLRHLEKWIIFAWPFLRMIRQCAWNVKTKWTQTDRVHSLGFSYRDMWHLTIWCDSYFLSTNYTCAM